MIANRTLIGHKCAGVIEAYLYFFRRFCDSWWSDVILAYTIVEIRIGIADGM